MKVKKHTRKKGKIKVKSYSRKRPRTGAWHTKKFIHGPRIKQPEEFKSLYTFTKEYADKRHVKLPKNIYERIQKYADKEDLNLAKDWKKKLRVKAGAINGNLKAQSVLTPLKNRGYGTKELPEIINEINKEIARQRTKEWYKQNRKKAKAVREKWRKENPEKTREYSRNYYNRNKEEVLDRIKKQYKRNPTRFLEASKKWQQANPEKAAKWRKENPEKYKASLEKHRKKKNES